MCAETAEPQTPDDINQKFNSLTRKCDETRDKKNSTTDEYEEDEHEVSKPKQEKKE